MSGGIQEFGVDVEAGAACVALDRTVHLDVRVVRVGLLGYGRIGQAIVETAGAEYARLREAGVELRFVRALVRDAAKVRTGPPVRLVTDPAAIVAHDLDVVIEVLGDVEPARALVVSALRAGIPVISANKTLMATCGLELRALAERHQTTLAFDAAVLAGVPFLGSLSRRPLVSAVRQIEGVVNGTSHFIVGAIERGASFEDALAEAVVRGYAEPDSSADTTGRDAAEKLTILLHLAGCRDVRVADLSCTGLEVLEPADLTHAHRLGGTIKPVAIASLQPGAAGAWVGPAFVPGEHAFARLAGVTNALQLTDASRRQVLFAGPGAGPAATAVTIIDDIVEAVTGGFSQSPAQPASGAGRVPASALRAPAPCAWFLRLRDASGAGGSDVTLTPALAWPAVRELIASFSSRGIRALALPVTGTGVFSTETPVLGTGLVGPSAQQRPVPN